MILHLQVISSLEQPQSDQLVANVTAKLAQLKRQKLVRKIKIPEAFEAAVKSVVAELSEANPVHNAAASQVNSLQTHAEPKVITAA